MVQRNAIRRKNFERDRKLIEGVKNGQSDDLQKLFDYYLPLIKSFWDRYYLRNLDFEDWEQEALIVMLKGVRHYQLARRVNFGAFYKSILRNRIYDLIRKQSAKKRVPAASLTSIDANESFYADTIRDFQAPSPEHRVLLAETFSRVSRNCSPLEKSILLGICQHLDFGEIARRNHYSEAKVVNAFERCKRKFKRLGLVND